MSRPTTVANLRREPYDVYIGRSKGDLASADPFAARGVPRPPARGCFGNPLAIDFAGLRSMDPEDARIYLESVMAGFIAYFEKRVETDAGFRAAVLELRGKRLGCFCKPGPCHGDVIAAWINAQLEEAARG